MKILPQKMWQFLIFKVILIVFAAHLVNSAMQVLEKNKEKIQIKKSDLPRKYIEYLIFLMEFSETLLNMR